MRFSAGCFIILAFLARPADAQDSKSPDGPPFEILHSWTNFALQSDGTFIQTFDNLYLLRTQQGVQGLTQTSVGFSESMQDGELTEVYTVKKDGQRIDAAPDQIFVRASPMATGAPMFNDYKLRIGLFPNTEIGDKVGFKGRIKQVKPLIPNQFSMSEVFSRGYLVDDLSVTLNAPSTGFPLSIDAVRIDNPPPAERDGRLYWSWRFKNSEIWVGDDNRSVDEFSRGARVVVSSIPDYATLAHLYQEGAAGKDQPTQAIAALAKEITAGQSDRREQARLLYEWVGKNIRYVAIAIGTGAIVPHSADEVLRNRYGDCKDHVILLQALLAAKSIPSSGALINTGAHFEVSKVAALLFNHIITYIPEFNLYADSTASYVPFGVLPFADVDRPVLLTKTGLLARTPRVTSADNGISVVTRVKVQEDGAANADSEVTVQGIFTIERRAEMANISRPDQEAAFLRQQFGGNAEGKLDKGDWQNLANSYVYRGHFNWSNYLSIPGPGAVSLAVLQAHPSVQSLAYPDLPLRHDDYQCPSGHFREETTIELPASLQLLAIPQNAEIIADQVRFSLSYEKLDDHTVRGIRDLVIDEPHRTCSAEYYNGLRPDLLKMRGRLRAMVLYQ